MKPPSLPSPNLPYSASDISHRDAALQALHPRPLTLLAAHSCGPLFQHTLDSQHAALTHTSTHPSCTRPRFSHLHPLPSASLLSNNCVRAAPWPLPALRQSGVRGQSHTSAPNSCPSLVHSACNFGIVLTGTNNSSNHPTPLRPYSTNPNPRPSSWLA